MKKTKLRVAIDEFVDEHWPDSEILLYGSQEGDPYDRGLVGIGFQQYKGPVAVYDREQCIDALAEEFASDENAYPDGGDDDPYSDAVEWFDYNTQGAWVGEQTPIIISRFQEVKR